MKKLFLTTTILLFYSQLAFAQTKTENKRGTQGLATGNYKPNKQETLPKVNSSDQSYQNTCYKNFAFTLKNYGYNKDGKFYSWGVAVKNNYSKAVQLRYKLIVGNDNSQVGTLTYYIKPGESYSNDMGLAKAIIVKNNSADYTIEVSEVCFEGGDCAKNGYVDCNGKQQGNGTVINNQNANEDDHPVNGVKEITEQGFKIVIEYKNGKPVNSKTYSKDNILLLISTIDSTGKVTEIDTFYPTGKKNQHAIFENGNFTWSTYDENGNIRK